MDETEDKLGGPGTIVEIIVSMVEIDEAKFGRQKYHRGRLVDGHWVLGGAQTRCSCPLYPLEMQPPYCPSSNIR